QVAVAAIEAGATAVLGSHPHLLQRIEEYQGGLIAYSLGNFVFDGYYGPENYSAILRLILNRNGLHAYDWFPVLIVNGLPQSAPPKQAEEIHRMLTR
ncbi:MAG: CapA family protein, partial [Anaerolineales bacterium]|nr:CapA family protein [Anaerolineales bacterium]